MAFQSVLSAGINIKTLWKRCWPNDFKSAQRFVATYDFVEWPKEKSHIVDRMLDVSNQTFRLVSFGAFDNIFFLTAEILVGCAKHNQRRLARAGSPEIMLLPGCSGVPYISSEVQSIVSAIESTIKGFILRELEDSNR